MIFIIIEVVIIVITNIGPKRSTFVHVHDGGGRTPTGDRHIEESKTAIEAEMSSSLRQHSKNSSKVTTPSWFLSIFYKKKIWKSH